jgi:hypothetical protein
VRVQVLVFRIPLATCAWIVRRGPQAISDLPVSQTVHDQTHDIELAWTQPRIAHRGIEVAVRTHEPLAKPDSDETGPRRIRIASDTRAIRPRAPEIEARKP